MSRMEALEWARRLVINDARAVESLVDQLGESFVAACGLLLQCTGKVLVTGMGTSGATAHRIAHLLSCCGTPALPIGAADGLHGGLGCVAANDTVIAISKGGESDELNNFVDRSKKRGAALIVLTESPTSSLGKLADVAVAYVTPPESDPIGMIAMGSQLAACAVGDALAYVLMQLRNYSQSSFEFTHPGGAVGRRIDSGH